MTDACQPAEDLLREPGRLYHQIFANAGEGIAVCDRDLRCLAWNPAMEALTGVPASAILSRPVLSILAAEQQDCLAGYLRLALAGETLSALRLSLEVPQSGTSGWVLATFAPNRDAEGTVTGVIALVRDITDQVRAEDDLRLFRAVVEASQEAVAIGDAEGRYLYVNPAHQALFGLSLEEARRRAHRDSYPPESRDVLARETLPALTRGESWEGELEALDAQGHRFPLWQKAGAIFDAKGRLRYSFAFMHDVTQERQARRVLEESEGRYRALVDGSFDAILLATPDGRILDCNQRASEMFGYPKAELLGAPAQALVPRDVAATFPAITAPVIARGGARLQSLGRRRNGRIFPVEVSSRLVTLRDEQLTVVQVRDTTNWVRVQETLSEQRNLLRTLLDNLPDGVYAKDREGRFTHCNMTLVRYLGLRHPREVVGKSDFDLFPEPVAQEFRAVEGRVLRTGQPYSSPDTRLELVEGTRWIHSVKVPMRDSEGSIVGLVGMIRDITLQKKAEEERQLLHERMQHTQKLESLGVLAGGIAHDFNNLLTGVLANAGLALGELPPDSPAARRLQSIETAAVRAAELTDQMLAYAGRGRFLVQSLDLSELVREMVQLLRSSIPEAVRLEEYLDPNLPAISADATQLRQVVMNLITNASEAIGNREGTIQIQTGVMAVDRGYLAHSYVDGGLPEGEAVFVRVADTGCGMDEATKARLFEPFFTTKFTGRGLGMAAVLGIVHGHHGAIRVESSPGQGSVFTVLLPPGEQPLASAPSVEPSPRQAASR